MFIFAAAATALFLSGCVSVNTSDGATQNPQISASHPGYEAVYTHKNTRVRGSAQINVLFNFITWGASEFADNSRLSFMSFLPSLDNLTKKAAVFNACKTHKADILVGTRYTVTTVDFLVFKTVRSDVEGFPAVMTGVSEKKPYAVGNKIYWLSEKPVAVK